MSNMFDQNTWYTIRGGLDGNALQSSGNVLVSANHKYGSAFISPYNASAEFHDFNWQFYPHPLNRSNYILRPANTDGTIYLTPIFGTAGGGNCGDDCSSTGVGVTNLTDTEASAWIVQPTGDGQTSWLSNEANTTDWRMAVNNKGAVPGSYLNMASTDGNQTLARWSFSSVSPIQDQRFSTIAPAFSSTTSASTPTQTSSSNSGSTKTHKKKTNIGGAVGGAIGGFIVLLLLVLALLWYLKRRRATRSNTHNHEQLPQYEEGAAYSNYDKKETSKEPGSASPEIAEAPADNAVHEAPQSRGEGMGGEAVNQGSVFELAGDEGSNRPKRENAKGKVLK